MCVDVESPHVGAKAPVEIGLSVSRPEEPQRLVRARGWFRGVLDVDADDKRPVLAITARQQQRTGQRGSGS